MTAFLIVTDLDSTLVGNNEYLAHFNRMFAEHRGIYGSRLVYATGRSLQLYQNLKSKVDLLSPDMLITSVGSEIYTSDGKIDSNWTNYISQDWDVEKVKQIAGNYDNLESQLASEQGSCKVSFHLRPQYRHILEGLRQELPEENIKAQVIYSSNRDVDVLPERSGKGNALNYVREKLGMPRSRTVACGDSGNDIALFTDKDIFGIIVGNARAELIEWYRKNQRPNLYLAASNSAEGILEGLREFGWIGD
jgi:sucrose-6-phosphatase